MSVERAPSAEPAPPPLARARARARVTGRVQGVGFRPYVYRLARAHGLAGFVFNDAHGVELEVEGSAVAVERFIARLAPDAPPLASVEGVQVEPLRTSGERAFAILPSARGALGDAPVTPDAATCADCLRELTDPSDRRFRYPFINCTNCGPRFTIVRGVPYDRPQTTMRDFRMCAACRAEYEDPADRRFHAQPNACPRCGPTLALLKPDGAPAALGAHADAIAAAAAALRSGSIVAIKGIGGFHLACDAADACAVARLRARKHREDKPFALMVPTLQAAGALVELGAEEASLLCSSARPIVLARRRRGAQVAAAVAPEAPELGLMLPYSPLHHLLLGDFGAPLVMTSGNASEEPIAYRDDDALRRLGPIAELVLTHDRAIHTRTDDSVVRVVVSAGKARSLLLRRSRGYVPAGMPLPDPVQDGLLACGAELKNTFCLGKGQRAWVSHHIGDLTNYETLRSFTEGIEHLQRLLGVTPRVVAHDLHPEYLSSKYALERDGVQLLGVQHHHAHLAACLAEHGHTGRAVGAVFDGTGYGSDGTVWGGELLVGDTADFQRVGMLMPVRMPGGERAIREPWRMACAWLLACAEDPAERAPAIPPALAREVDRHRWEQVAQLSRSGLNSPLTSSVGRLFDAIAALCGLRARINYEGQAAIELEAACDPSERGAYPISVAVRGQGISLDPRELVLAAATDAARGVAPGTIASRFHEALARATVRACALAAAAHGTELVVLSGGAFANRRLLARVSAGLDRAGLRVLVPERLPVGDGGISYGQAAVAARRTATGLLDGV